MLHQPGGAGIGEPGSEPFCQPDHSISLAQQQRTSIRGDRAAVETGHHPAEVCSGILVRLNPHAAPS
jgi:hypothetical protein